MGATINKILPNMRRLVNPNDKKAIAEIQEIEEFQDSLRTAFPSAVFGGEVALPAATATATMGLGAGAALAAAPIEAAALTSGDQSPRTNAAIAAVLPFVPDALKKAGSAAGEVFESVIRRGGDIAAASPEKQAGRAIKRFIDETGASASNVLDERQSLGQGATLADVPSMEGLAQGAALTPQGRTYMPAFEKRQASQQPRIMEKLSSITGKKADNFTGDLKMFIEERAAAAGPYYKSAFEQDFIPSENFKTLFSRLKNSGALKKAKEIAKIEGREIFIPSEKSKALFKRLKEAGKTKTLKKAKKKAKIEGGEIDPSQVNYSDLHSAKIAVDDLILEAKQTGASNKAGALNNLKKDLLQEIETNNPNYKMARLQYSGDSGVINAAELGSDIFNPKKQGLKLSIDQLKEEVQSMSTDEFTAFQGGMAKAVSDKIADIPETADAARRLWARPKIKETLKVAFENESQFNSFLSGLEKETQFTNTLRKLYQGSQTAQRQAGQQALKTGDIAALEPFKKILKGELTVDGITELTRLMFDPKVANEEIKKVMIDSGVINETATTKAVEAMRKRWESVWSRVNLPSINTQSKAALSTALAPALNNESLTNE